MAEALSKTKRGIRRRMTMKARSSLSGLYSSRSFSWVAIVFLAVMATFMTTLSFQTIPSRIQAGLIASRDIKADRNYEIIDEEASQKFREEAMASVLPVFDFDVGLSDVVTARVGDAFKAARSALKSWLDLQNAKARIVSGAKLPEEAKKQIGQIFSEHLGIVIPDNYIQALIADNFDDQTEAAITALVKGAMSVPLVSERVEGEFPAGEGAIIRKIDEKAASGQNYQETVIEDVGNLRTVVEARERIMLSPVFSAISSKGKDLPEAIVAVARLLIKPNCVLNRPETNRKLEAAASGAKNVILKVSAGEMIVREGSRYEPRHIKILSAIVKEKRKGSYYLEFLGTFILSLLFLFVPFRLLKKYFRRVQVNKTDYVLMAFIGLSVLIIMRISLMLAPAVSDALLISIDPSTLHYAVPIAGAAMLLRMFLGAEISLVFALVMSVLAGFFVEADVRLMAFSFISSMAGVMAIANVDRRSMIIRAGAITGGVGALAVVGISFVESVVAGSGFQISELLWGILFAFLGGIGSAIYTMIGAPIIESVSGYTSDIKLLELANLNHPLLRELIVRAPGTYHHSHVVGLLGEAAASEIGANALLVRVGAYYHDLGKIKKPLYFVENAKAGEDKHEKLTPQMSSLIVSAHVKDGVELTQSANIPKCITDMIP
ncbi:MAG: HDIG domain-containing metalloprotein [Pseudomonadota bacterium]